MKKMMRKALVAIMALGLSQTAHAQLGNMLKKAAGGVANSSTAGSVLSSVVSNLLGTSALSESNLVGTWTYNGPCVVLESDNVLSNIGGTVVTSKVEEEFGSALKKIGFTQGKVVLTLNEDKTFSMTVAGKPVKGTWSVEDSNLVLTVLGKAIKINAKLSAGQLQLAASADKMLTLLNTVMGSASSVNSTFGTVSKLLANYKGLYLGLKFSK